MAAILKRRALFVPERIRLNKDGHLVPCKQFRPIPTACQNSVSTTVYFKTQTVTDSGDFRLSGRSRQKRKSASSRPQFGEKICSVRKCHRKVFNAIASQLREGWMFRTVMSRLKKSVGDASVFFAECRQGDDHWVAVTYATNRGTSRFRGLIAQLQKLSYIIPQTKVRASEKRVKPSRVRKIPRSNPVRKKPEQPWRIAAHHIAAVMEFLRQVAETGSLAATPLLIMLPELVLRLDRGQGKFTLSIYDQTTGKAVTSIRSTVSAVKDILQTV